MVEEQEGQADLGPHNVTGGSDFQNLIKNEGGLLLPGLLKDQRKSKDNNVEKAAHQGAKDKNKQAKNCGVLIVKKAKGIKHRQGLTATRTNR